jgi:uncharacterized protein (UPF0333 family)
MRMSNMRKFVSCASIVAVLLFVAVAQSFASGSSSSSTTASDDVKVAAATAAAGAAAIAGASGGPGKGKRFGEAVREAARRLSGNICVFCGRETTSEDGPGRSEIDHAIPRSREGNNTPENAQNTCRSCNREKGTETTEEYLDRMRTGGAA